MSERIDVFAGDPVGDLRTFILSKALGMPELAESLSRRNYGRVDIYPFGGEHPRYSMSIFKEGVEEDGAIAQVSILDTEITEGHIILHDTDTTYEEVNANYSLIADGQIEPYMASTLLTKLESAFE